MTTPLRPTPCITPPLSTSPLRAAITAATRQPEPEMLPSLLQQARMSDLQPQDVCDLCAGFQAAVLDLTADRITVGLRLFHEQFGPPRALVAAGGVAVNLAIRNALQDIAAKAQTTLIIPPPALCTDNGAMIAWAGAERLALGMLDGMASAPRARWRLDEATPTPAKFAKTRAQH